MPLIQILLLMIFTVLFQKFSTNFYAVVKEVGKKKKKKKPVSKDDLAEFDIREKKPRILVNETSVKRNF